ncbi:MAG TPA: hypothetical protein VEA69_18030, partial [Tepidisphaeraceae bacterium]|nr:hypothetical protein [Tepidisphaeraceae bacterium]
MNLLIATTNPGKIKEFREMLGGTSTAFDDLAAHRHQAHHPPSRHSPPLSSTHSLPTSPHLLGKAHTADFTTKVRGTNL